MEENVHTKSVRQMWSITGFDSLKLRNVIKGGGLNMICFTS